MEAAVVEVIRSLAVALEAIGARWYIFGAQAVVIHGRPRMTEDVDITVERTPSGSRQLVAAMETAGLRLRVPDIDDFVVRTWVIPLVHVATGIGVDVVLAGSGLEEQFLTRARPEEIGGTMVPVISPGDLVVTKILAGRPKDLEDVIGVLKAHDGALELGRIRALLQALEEATDQSGLVLQFERALRQAGQTGGARSR